MEPKVGEIWDMNDDIYGLVLITKIVKSTRHIRSSKVYFLKLSSHIIDNCKLFWFDNDYRKMMGVCKPTLNLTSNLTKLLFLGE